MATVRWAADSSMDRKPNRWAYRDNATRVICLAHFTVPTVQEQRGGSGEWTNATNMGYECEKTDLGGELLDLAHVRSAESNVR